MADSRAGRVPWGEGSVPREKSLLQARGGLGAMTAQSWAGAMGKTAVSAAVGRVGEMELEEVTKITPAALNNHQAFGSSKLCLVGG